MIPGNFSSPKHSALVREVHRNGNHVYWFCAVGKAPRWRSQYQIYVRIAYLTKTFTLLSGVMPEILSNLISAGDCTICCTAALVVSLGIGAIHTTRST